MAVGETQQTSHLLCMIDLDSNANTHKQKHTNTCSEGERKTKRERRARCVEPRGITLAHSGPHFISCGLCQCCLFTSWEPAEAGGGACDGVDLETPSNSDLLLWLRGGDAPSHLLMTRQKHQRLLCQCSLPPWRSGPLSSCLPTGRVYLQSQQPSADGHVHETAGKWQLKSA